MMATDLDIVGTPADDHVTVVLVDGSFQSVQVGDNQLEFTSGDVKTVEYESGGGDDVLRLELGVHQAESSLDDRTSSQDSSIVDAALSQLDADNDNELTNRDMLTHANRHNAVMNRMLGQFGVNRDCTDAHDVVLTEFGTDVEISSTNGLVDRAQDALSEGPLVITESEAIADEQDVSEPATLELSTNDDETSAIAEPSHWAEPTLLSGGNGNIVVFGDANTIIVNPSSPSSVPSPSLPIFVQPPVPVPPDVNSPATTEPTPADVTAHVTLSGIGVVEVQALLDRDASTGVSRGYSEIQAGDTGARRDVHIEGELPADLEHGKLSVVASLSASSTGGAQDTDAGATIDLSVTFFASDGSEISREQVVREQINSHGELVAGPDAYVVEIPYGAAEFDVHGWIASFGNQKGGVTASLQGAVGLFELVVTGTLPGVASPPVDPITGAPSLPDPGPPVGFFTPDAPDFGWRDWYNLAGIIAPWVGLPGLPPLTGFQPSPNAPAVTQTPPAQVLPYGATQFATGFNQFSSLGNTLLRAFGADPVLPAFPNELFWAFDTLSGRSPLAWGPFGL